MIADTAPNINKALAVLGRRLYDLSELAREISGLCDSNSILPALDEARMDHQMGVLGIIEQRMLSVADAITAFEKAASRRGKSSAPGASGASPPLQDHEPQGDPVLALTMKQTEEIHVTNERTGDLVVLRLRSRKPIGSGGHVRINITAPPHVRIARAPNRLAACPPPLPTPGADARPALDDGGGA